ncbi:MAG: NAD(P)/FAD-dependent oxidoreductase [Bacillota bacterium]
MNKIIVIGGGASGMMAAIKAAEAGGQVEIRERNNLLGKKLAITGKGRCNITNDCTVDEVIKNVPGNGSFLYSSLYAFSPQDTRDFFENLGLKLKVERGRRVFPLSDDAHQVVEALKKRLQQLGVKIIYNNRIERLAIEKNIIKGVFCRNNFIAADRVIIATGGKSYPATGSSGDGYLLAQEAGHSIISLRPSLVPLETKEVWPQKLSGLTLKNVQVTVKTRDEKKGEQVIDKAFGEMLFTHFGVSGPLILTLSHNICKHLSQKEVKIYINLKPALEKEQLKARLQRDLDQFSKKHFQNSLNELLPSSLIPVVVELSGIPPHKEANQINKSERDLLVELLRALPLTIKKARPLEEAIVTAGGVNVKEIDPKTMQSKLVEGLYFTGEVLDIDGFTGGYNLQIAFSTGAAAGIAAARASFM